MSNSPLSQAMKRPRIEHLASRKRPRSSQPTHLPADEQRMGGRQHRNRTRDGKLPMSSSLGKALCKLVTQMNKTSKEIEARKVQLEAIAAARSCSVEALADDGLEEVRTKYGHIVTQIEQMRRGAFIPVSPTKAMKHRERSVANMKKKQQEQHLALLAPRTSTMGAPKPTLTAAPLPSKSKWGVGGHSSRVVSC